MHGHTVATSKTAEPNNKPTVEPSQIEPSEVWEFNQNANTVVLYDGITMIPSFNYEVS